MPGRGPAPSAQGLTHHRVRLTSLALCGGKNTLQPVANARLARASRRSAACFRLAMANSCCSREACSHCVALASACRSWEPRWRSVASKLESAKSRGKGSWAVVIEVFAFVGNTPYSDLFSTEKPVFSEVQALPARRCGEVGGAALQPCNGLAAACVFEEHHPVFKDQSHAPEPHPCNS